jgi:hypothetical protein
MNELEFEGCNFHLYEKTIRVVRSPDERSKKIGLFGLKQASYISPLLNFFLFLFDFFAIRK